MAVVRGTNCGFVTATPAGDPGGSNVLFDTRAYAFKDTSPATAVKITEIGIYVDNATEEANIDFAIYTNNPGDGEPEAIVIGKINVAKGTASGWKKQSCNITISPSTVYWIAAQLDNTATATNMNATGDAAAENDYKLSETELVDPWGSSDGTFTQRLAIYAKWEAVAGGTILPQIISAYVGVSA